MEQLAFFGSSDEKSEDLQDVLKVLTVRCQDCRLGLLRPTNHGLVYRGNPNASIAIVTEAPRDGETERGTVLLGSSGRLLEKWFQDVLQIDISRQAFLLATVQCQPEKKKIKGVLQQRAAAKDEIKACFGPRTLRVLRAMPNLQVVITLGWGTAETFLGQRDNKKPNAKTHQAQYFESTLLPGIPIFCLPDPYDIMVKPTPDKIARVKNALANFKREHLEQNKVVRLAQLVEGQRKKNNDLPTLEAE